jgi:hypothetical protein
MDRRRVVLIIVVSVFLVANVWLLGMRRTIDPPQVSAEREKQKQLQVERVMQWEGSPAAALRGDSLVDAIRQISARNCNLKSDPRTAELSSEQQSHLVQTLVALITAYVEGDVKLFLDCLRERGEVIVPHYDAALRKILTDEAGLDRKLVAEFTWEEMIAQYWETAKVSAGWKDVRIDESCIWTWRADSMQMAAGTPSLFVESAQLFQNQTTVGHIFYSETANVDFIARDGHVLVADVLLVIGHDVKQNAGVSPYMMRFWFDPVSDCWRPIMLVHVDTIGVDSPRILF